MLALDGGPRAVTIEYRYAWPKISEAEIAIAADLLRRGEISYYGRDGVVAELEDAFAAYHGLPYALGTSSGTAALHSAYFGLGLRPGDEVIAPTYTFLATVTPLFVVNAIPVLADADPETGNVDPSDIERKITERTKAIVVTHMWGHPCDMAPIMEIARRHNLRVVEDCSHAHGSRYKGQLVGTFGDVACFSLQGAKIIAGGQAGILLTRDYEIYERATLLGHFRKRAEETVTSEKYRPYARTGFGLNYRMHPIAAALALYQFGQLEERIAARHANLDYLSELLEPIGGIRPPVTRPAAWRGAFYGYKPHQVPEEVRGVSLRTYIRALRAEGVDVSSPGSAPLHLEPLFQEAEPPLLSHGFVPPDFAAYRRVYRPGDLPASEEYYRTLLSLPTFTEPVPTLMEQYAGAFAKVVRQSDRLYAIDQLDPGRGWTNSRS